MESCHQENLNIDKISINEEDNDNLDEGEILSDDETSNNVESSNIQSYHNEDGLISQDNLQEKADLEEGELDDDEGSGIESLNQHGQIKKEAKTNTIHSRVNCKFFSRGNCSWGSNCRFLHTPASGEGQSSAPIYPLMSTYPQLSPPLTLLSKAGAAKLAAQSQGAKGDVGAKQAIIKPLMDSVDDELELLDFENEAVFVPKGPEPLVSGPLHDPMNNEGIASSADTAQTKAANNLPESAWERGLRQAKELMKRSATMKKEHEIENESQLAVARHDEKASLASPNSGSDNNGPSAASDAREFGDPGGRPENLTVTLVVPEEEGGAVGPYEGGPRPLRYPPPQSLIPRRLYRQMDPYPPHRIPYYDAPLAALGRERKRYFDEYGAPEPLPHHLDEMERREYYRSLYDRRYLGPPPPHVYDRPLDSETADYYGMGHYRAAVPPPYEDYGYLPKRPPVSHGRQPPPPLYPHWPPPERPAEGYFYERGRPAYYERGEAFYYPTQERPSLEPRYFDYPKASDRVPRAYKRTHVISPQRSLHRMEAAEEFGGVSETRLHKILPGSAIPRRRTPLRPSTNLGGDSADDVSSTGSLERAPASPPSARENRPPRYAPSPRVGAGYAASSSTPGREYEGEWHDPWQRRNRGGPHVLRRAGPLRTPGGAVDVRGGGTRGHPSRDSKRSRSLSSSEGDGTSGGSTKGHGMNRYQDVKRNKGGTSPNPAAQSSSASLINKSHMNMGRRSKSPKHGTMSPRCSRSQSHSSSHSSSSSAATGGSRTQRPLNGSPHTSSMKRDATQPPSAPGQKVPVTKGFGNAASEAVRSRSFRSSSSSGGSSNGAAMDDRNSSQSLGSSPPNGSTSQSTSSHSERVGPTLTSLKPGDENSGKVMKGGPKGSVVAGPLVIRRPKTGSTQASTVGVDVSSGEEAALLAADDDYGDGWTVKRTTLKGSKSDVVTSTQSQAAPSAFERSSSFSSISSFSSNDGESVSDLASSASPPLKPKASRDKGHQPSTALAQKTLNGNLSQNKPAIQNSTARVSPIVKPQGSSNALQQQIKMTIVNKSKAVLKPLAENVNKEAFSPLSSDESEHGITNNTKSSKASNDNKVVDVDYHLAQSLARDPIDKRRYDRLSTVYPLPNPQAATMASKSVATPAVAPTAPVVPGKSPKKRKEKVTKGDAPPKSVGTVKGSPKVTPAATNSTSSTAVKGVVKNNQPGGLGNASSRREELLKQLRAVEEAIARKRTK